MAPESDLDCLTCGACCFSRAPDYVRLSGADHARLAPTEQERLTVFRGNRCFMRMADGRCAALAVGDGRFVCTIYERRPGTCRDLERGGDECLGDRERALRLAL